MVGDDLSKKGVFDKIAKTDIGSIKIVPVENSKRMLSGGEKYENSRMIDKETLRRQALIMTEEYYETWSKGNGESLKFLSDSYSDLVDFYGESRMKYEVLQEKKDFVARWPKRAYGIKDDTIKINCSDHDCQVTGVVEWYTISSRQEQSSGAAEFLLLWDVANKSLISESGKVLERDTDARKPLRIAAQWKKANHNYDSAKKRHNDGKKEWEKLNSLTGKLMRLGWCPSSAGGYGDVWYRCINNDVKFSMESIQLKKKSQFLEPTDYSVSEIYKGRIIYPDFNKRDRGARAYRTRIREGMKEGVNYAGYYSFIEVGCGTDCRFAFVANNTTGEVFNFPLGGEENMHLTIDYWIDSSLVIATWSGRDKNDERRCHLNFFDFKNGKWNLLRGKEFKLEEDEYNCSSIF